ncbi:hypothetical protein V1478_008144 [Vespula squamosa]|uniref:Uncharacterized protein n=1 Tax=Vespula squamosa TaxID=30214 RepID=A0ABD2AXY5_VESSQ
MEYRCYRWQEFNLNEKTLVEFYDRRKDDGGRHFHRVTLNVLTLDVSISFQLQSSLVGRVSLEVIASYFRFHRDMGIHSEYFETMDIRLGSPIMRIFLRLLSTSENNIESFKNICSTKAGFWMKKFIDTSNTKDTPIKFYACLQAYLSFKHGKGVRKDTVLLYCNNLHTCEYYRNLVGC